MQVPLLVGSRLPRTQALQKPVPGTAQYLQCTWIVKLSCTLATIKTRRFRSPFSAAKEKQQEKDANTSTRVAFSSIVLAVFVVVVVRQVLGTSTTDSSGRLPRAMKSSPKSCHALDAENHPYICQMQFLAFTLYDMQKLRAHFWACPKDAAFEKAKP